jgi:hypothetical protein
MMAGVEGAMVWRVPMRDMLRCAVLLVHHLYFFRDYISKIKGMTLHKKHDVIYHSIILVST